MVSKVLKVKGRFTELFIVVNPHCYLLHDHGMYDVTRPVHDQLHLSIKVNTPRGCSDHIYLDKNLRSFKLLGADQKLLLGEGETSGEHLTWWYPSSGQTIKVVGRGGGGVFLFLF